MAVDVARILLKPAADLAVTDMPEPVLDDEPLPVDAPPEPPSPVTVA